MKILDSTLIVLSVNGVVVNNAFNYLLNSTYYIYNSSITNFSMDLWLSIQDPINLEKAFRISNSQNIKYVCTVSQIFSYNTTVKIIFIRRI